MDLNFNNDVKVTQQEALDTISSNSKKLESSRLTGDSYRNQDNQITEIKFQLNKSILENRAKSQLESLQQAKKQNVSSALKLQSIQKSVSNHFADASS